MPTTVSLDEAISTRYAHFDVDKYLVAPQHAIAQGRKRLNTVARHLPPRRDANIIELGCGNGGFLAALRQAGYTNLAGCDRCPPLVQYAGSQLNLDVACADALAFLRDQTKPVDCIVAFDLIEHLDREALFALLCQARSVLRPGGCVIGATPNGDCPRAFYAMISDLTHRLVLTPRTLGFIARLAGFNQVRTYPKYLGSPLPGLVDRLVKTVAYPFLAAMHFAYFFHWPRLITANMIFVLSHTDDTAP